MVELCCCCCRVDTALMEGPGIKWKYNVKLVDGDLGDAFELFKTNIFKRLESFPSSGHR